MAFIDAVHFAPHGLIDVRALDCDFLACSSYKFFGPHVGVMFGKREHLQRLRPYKLRACYRAVARSLGKRHAESRGHGWGHRGN